VPTRSPRISTLGHHKASGQAVVRLNNRDHSLGKHCTPECQAAYDRRIALWMANGRQTAAPGSDLTIAELMLAWRGRSRPQSGSAEPNDAVVEADAIIGLNLVASVGRHERNPRRNL
jgi:hypothetical protein